MSWQTLDVEALQNRREEATTSGAAGAFPVPFGGVLRATFPQASSGYKLVALPERYAASGGYMDPDYAWALKQVK